VKSKEGKELLKELLGSLSKIDLLTEGQREKMRNIIKKAMLLPSDSLPRFKNGA